MARSSQGGYAVTFTVVDQATAQIEAINRRMRQMREPLERFSRASTRFLDASGLNKMAEGFRGIGTASATAFSSMSRLVPVMGTLTSATTIGGMAALINRFGGMTRELRATSTQINSTPQALERMRRAYQLAGGDVNDVTASLQGLTATSAAAFTGDAKAAQWFQRAGVAIRGANGELRTAEELLPEVIQHIDGLRNPTDQLTTATNLGGESLRTMVQQLRTARQPGETLRQTYERLNTQASNYKSTSDTMIQVQSRYDQAIGKVTVGLNSLGTQSASTLQEGITPLLEGFGSWLADLESSPEKMKIVENALKGLTAFFGVTLVGGIAKAVAKLATFWASPAIVGLTALAGAVGGLQRLSENAAERAEREGISTSEAVAKEVLLPDTQGRIERVQEQRAAREAAGDTRSWWQRNAPTILGGQQAPGITGARYGELSDPRYQAGGARAFNWGNIGITGGKTRGYGSAEEGLQALQSNLLSYQNKYNVNTLGGIISRWSPPNENPTPELIANAAKRTGFDPAQRLDLNDPSTMRKVTEAIVMQEHGRIPPQIASLLSGSGAPGEVQRQGEGAIPADILETAKTVALTGGPEAVDQFLRSNGYNRPSAWCGTFAASVVKSHGLDPPKDPQIASNWRNWGAPVSGLPAAGHVAVRRGGQTGATGSHVTFVESVDPAAGTFTAIGGNQGLSKAERLAGRTGRSTYRLSQFDFRQPEMAALTNQLAEAQGAPKEVTGGAPVSGSVDVTVTHRNPPPGATVTARGDGDVNVASPRTEFQMLDAA